MRFNVNDFYRMEMLTVLVVIICAIAIMFIAWKCLHVEETHFNWEYLLFEEGGFTPLAGGSMDDVLTKVQTEKLRNNGKDAYRAAVVRAVRNGVNAYRRETRIDVADEDIEFIGQGYQNVVVRFGKDGPLVRIAKNIRPQHFDQFKRVYDSLKRNADSGFLTPTRYSFSKTKGKEYMYWEIRELQPIERIDFDKLKACIFKAISYISSKYGFSYIDFKYENIMIEPETGEYLIADFDLYDKMNVMKQIDHLLKGSDPIRAASDRVEKFVDNRFDYCSNQEFAKNMVVAGFVEKDGGAYKLLDGFDPYSMFPAINARLFLLKVMQDMHDNKFEGDSTVLVDDSIIENLLSMNSTNPRDVVNV